MKRPNGTGSISKLSGKRRKPYVVRVTSNYSGERRAVVIGCYETYTEAATALADYSRTPFDLSARDVTFAETYKKWIVSPCALTLSAGTLKNLQTAYNVCVDLVDVPYCDLKARDMQNCIDNMPAASTQRQIKVLFGHLDKYAFKNDIINKKYSDSLAVMPIIPQKTIKIFTKNEIQSLWKICNGETITNGKVYDGALLSLMLLYGGWRAGELMSLKVSGVDIEKGVMYGGSKTKAGKGRIVPIHIGMIDIITHLVKLKNNKVNVSENDFFIWPDELEPRKRYYRLSSFFGHTMAAIRANHTLHETRHTFRTELDRVGANKVCVDKIMGHKNQDIGLGIYVQKSIDELKDAVNLITYNLN